MPASVLVGYATRYGSTKEVAEAIAAVLRECRIAVVCQPMKDVRSLDGFDAVVLGAPLYMFHWHKEMLNFLPRHRQALAERPVAVFALGPFGDDPKGWDEVRRQLAAELQKFPSLTPVAAEVFGGKFDPTALTFPHNLVPGLKKMAASDLRDWVVIRGWANDLPEKLRLER